MLQTVRTYAGQASLIKIVTVIGGGQMGSGIAQVIAQSGQTVTLVEVNEENLKKAKKNMFSSIKYLAKKQKKEKLEEYIDPILERITFSLDMEEPASKSDLVIEAVVEDLKIKRNIFSKLDKVAPEKTIFGTNTSSISVRDISCATNRRDRFAGLHFFNPVPVLKLVELVRTDEVSSETYAHLKEWIRSINRVPIACKDTPGFIVNRLLFPLLCEAIRLYERGDAEAKDIDLAMKLGCNFPMGPIELTDWIGHDTIAYAAKIWRDLHPGNPLFAPLPSQLKLIEEGKLGVKAGEGYYKYE